MSNFYNFMIHLELTDLRSFVICAKTVNSANILIPPLTLMSLKYYSEDFTLLACG